MKIKLQIGQLLEQEIRAKFSSTRRISRYWTVKKFKVLIEWLNQMWELNSALFSSLGLSDLPRVTL